MHYAVVVSDLVLRGTPRLRRRIRSEKGSAIAFHVPAAAHGAWRNWWTMSVVEEPPYAARQTKVIGARGRSVVPQ